MDVPTQQGAGFHWSVWKAMKFFKLQPPIFKRAERTFVVGQGTGAELDRAPGLIAQHMALAVADETEATRERRRAGGAG